MNRTPRGYRRVVAREIGTGRKLVVFALGVAVAFGGGALLGSAIGPEPSEEPATPVEHVDAGDHG